MSAPSPVPAPSYLTASRGVASWLATTDHKRIALLYLFGIATAATVGGVLALLLGIEAATSGETLVDRMTHARLFTLHGMVMVFAVAIPAIPAVIGNFVLPLQLGADNLALPRLNRLGFYCWLGGVILLLAGFAAGGSDTGWELTPPYSIETTTWVLFSLAGLGLLSASGMMVAVNTLVTLRLSRPPEMGWFDLPLGSWTLAIAATIEVITAPVFLAALILLGGERTLGLGLFDPTLGGDPLRFSQLFWFHAHPALFASAIAAIGLVAEILATFSRRRLALRPLVYGCLGLGLFGLLSWGVGERVDGDSDLAALWFSAAALAVAVPATVVVGNLLATLRGGVTELPPPMIYGLGFVLFFTLAVIAGLVLATPGAGDPLGATLFSVAHLHYLAVGTTVVGFLAALHYWWPKIFGRACPAGPARWVALAVVATVNLALVPRLILGVRGTLGRAYDYPPAAETLQLVAAVGTVALGLALLAAVLLLCRSVFRGAPAPADPWHVATLAWTTASPPPPDNFAAPTATRPRPRDRVRVAGGWALVAGTCFFAGLIAAFWGVRTDHPEILGYGRRYLAPLDVALATGALIAVSAALAWAVRAAATARRRTMTAALVIALAGALGFTTMTALDYARRSRAGTLWGTKFDPCSAPEGDPLPCRRDLAAADTTAGIHGAAPVRATVTMEVRRQRILHSLPPDRVPPANTGLFFAIYFAATGLLLVLLLGGGVGLGWVLAMARRAGATEEHHRVAAIASYFHFVTAAWLALIAVLYLGV